jgi:glutaredoxin
MWRALPWLLLALMAPGLMVVVACDDHDGGTTPSADATLPPLQLTDNTPDLLLTWLDERGNTHTGASALDVPEASKEQVRVITKDAGHGNLIYVADLTRKGEDGTYAVRTMPRHEWEDLIAKRRDAYRQKHAPPPTPKASSQPKPDALPDGVSAVVYGASWCKPCHDAVAYLERRGVHVVEYDVEREPERATEMQSKLAKAGKKGGTIPIIDIGGQVLVGFSPGAIDRALKTAGPGDTKL